MRVVHAYAFGPGWHPYYRGGLYLTARDLDRSGYLYLRDGV